MPAALRRAERFAARDDDAPPLPFQEVKGFPELSFGVGIPSKATSVALGFTGFKKRSSQLLQRREKAKHLTAKL